LVDIVELACRALCAEIVDQVVAWFADAPSLDPILIDCANGTANSIASLSACFLVAVNAVTALVFLVVDLSLRVADAALSSDQVVAGKASAGADGRVPNFVDFARSVADAIGRIVDLSGRTNPAGVANQIVPSFALASSIFPLLISIASSSAKAKVRKIATIADTGLSDGVIARMEGTGAASAVR